jgi:endoglucanase
MLQTLFRAAMLALFGVLATVSAAAAAQGDAAPRLGRGVNILGYDPIWENPARGRFQERHFAAIRSGGFDFVRVNLHGFRHMDAENRLSPEFLSRLDWVVKGATGAGLSVILDEHDFMACAENVVTCRTRLAAFWSQVAPRYRDAPQGVLFELLNEPHGPLDAATWNGLFPQLLAIVRQSNPERWVVIGPTQWNHFSQLPTLKLPENDRRILATFHYYEPFHFTHQGATWAGEEVKKLSVVTWGSEADRAKLRADFEQAAAWSKATGRPVLLGEFGAYDKSGTPLAMRLAYVEAVAREAERHGLAWAYWQFDSDFIVWDMARDGWVEPVHRALIPPAAGGDRG